MPPTLPVNSVDLAAPAMAPPAADPGRLIIAMNVMVPMRDGVKLRTDIYRPAFPPRGTLLLGTPYNSKTPWLMCLARKMAKRGFTVIVQNNRGRFGSEGQFRAFKDERTDGIDTLSWIAQQPWNNGKVGLFGVCYSAYSSYPLTAAVSPPGARVVAAVWCMEVIDLYDLVYPGGVLRLHWALPWLELMRSTGQVDILGNWPADGESARWEEVVSALPLSSAEDKLGGKIPTWMDWLQHPVYSSAWKSWGIDEDFARTTVPALHISGWFDPCLGQTISSFNQLQARLGNQALIVGPWDHTTLLQSLVSSALAGAAGKESNHDQTAGYSLFDRILSWFDRWFDEDSRKDEAKPVEFFLAGENRWQTEQRWPPASIEWCKLYLGSKGRLETSHPEGEGGDSYIYDPQNPVPTMGGDIFPLGNMRPGALDQSSIESRSDCLVFTTDVFKKPLHIAGPVRAVLYVSSSTVDTDFTVKLTDTSPDGSSHIVQDGIFRMRYRESRCKAKLIKPGSVYRISVEIGNVAHRFDTGHRLKAVISSSNFPKFDRNLNTPQDPESGSQWTASKQEIFWGGLRASFLHLPVMGLNEPAPGKSTADSWAGQAADPPERRAPWE